MSKFIIDWCEQKTTSTGKTKLNTTLKDDKGNQTVDVTIWQDYPNFATLQPGSEVEGDLVAAKDPKYGPTLYPPRSNLGAKPGWAKKDPAAITKAMERKEQGIERFQASKEESIKMAGAMRDATLITLAEFSGQPFDAEQFKDRWYHWRSWLLEAGEQPF